MVIVVGLELGRCHDKVSLPYWFPKDKGLGIQQGTSVWVGSLKSLFEELECINIT